MKGVFWIIEDKIIAYPFDGCINEGVAKAGDTYNRKLLWEYIHICNKPFDYYPRGRVEINSNGVTVIYMNPNIDEKFIPKISTAFGLTSAPIIRYDYSEHYKCNFDKD